MKLSKLLIPANSVYSAEIDQGDTTVLLDSIVVRLRDILE